MKCYAIIDPNWKEPIPVLSTIAATQDEVLAKMAADPNLRLYGGGSEFPLPRGTANTYANLARHGYRMGEIEITITL